MADKEKLTPAEVDSILACLATNYKGAPAEVKGAVLVLASQDTGGVFGFSCNALKHEVYARSRQVLNDWVLRQVMTPEDFEARQKAQEEAKSRLDEIYKKDRDDD